MNKNTNFFLTVETTQPKNYDAFSFFKILEYNFNKKLSSSFLTAIN